MKTRLLVVLLLLGHFMAGGIPETSAQPPRATPPAPAVDHLLLEVKDLDRSIRFYRDYLGLQFKKKSGDFVMLEAANVGVYLWAGHWKWSPRPSSPHGLRPPSGMYPHFAVADTKGLVAKLRLAGYKIVADAKDYNYGTEAFVSDPDGYVWSLITKKK